MNINILTRRKINKLNLFSINYIECYYYEYKGKCHLIKDGIDLLEGKNATYCCQENGEFVYRSRNKWFNL